MSPFQPGATQEAPEPKQPPGLAGKVGHLARQRPPDPRGKGLVIAVIAGVAVIAAIYQVTTGSGAGKTVRDQRAKDARAIEEHRTDLVAPTDPHAETPPTTRPVEIVEVLPDEPPMTMPGANIPLPEGLRERTAGRLRLSLNALTGGGLVAESGIRELPLILADAAADERDVVRGVVIDSLAALIGSRRLGSTAVDAAIRLAGEAETGLGPITRAVLARGLEDDRGVAAALVYLEHLPPEGREGAVEAVTGLVTEKGRPLHLRVLAARTLNRWNVGSDELAALAEDPRTPAALRKALAAE